jgi:hypothetical protein
MIVKDDLEESVRSLFYCFVKYPVHRGLRARKLFQTLFGPRLEPNYEARAFA